MKFSLYMAGDDKYIELQNMSTFPTCWPRASLARLRLYHFRRWCHRLEGADPQTHRIDVININVLQQNCLWFSTPTSML